MNSNFQNYIDPCVISDNPCTFTCAYCNTRLTGYEIDDIWEISEERILNIHGETIKAFKEFHGLEDCYLNLRMDTVDWETVAQICPACGWWRIIKHCMIAAEEWQIWNMHFGCTSTIRNLDLTDISIPIEEVNAYLTAKYDDRFIVSPRKFEDVVAAVFRNLGYYASATAYSKDGGIDVIMEGTNDTQIGVQVKRYKNSIKAEQIRSLAGALILGNYTKGMFVTTSTFQKSAITTAEDVSYKTMPVELIDGKDFYSKLRISQQLSNKFTLIPIDIKTEVIPELYYFGYDNPCNSL